MIEKVGEEVPEESSTHKEVIRTIASGINSLKTQLINMTNKNKKMWRAVARSSSETVPSSLTREQQLLEVQGESNTTPGRYNLRQTPTRQAAASRTQKQVTRAALAGEQQEGTRTSSSSSNGEDTTDEMGQTDTTCTHSLSKTDKISEESGGQTESTDSNETVDTKSLEPTKEPSTELTVTVPVTELEKAKQMAQQLTALITNLEHQESGLAMSSEHV